MATKETADLGLPHHPKEESTAAFASILEEIKKELVHMRHNRDKHEKQYFAAALHFSDEQLTALTPASLTQVRVATTAYGTILFGKLNIEGSDLYIHVRVFVTGDPKVFKLHCIHTEETEVDGEKKFRALFGKDDPLDWFDT